MEISREVLERVARLEQGFEQLRPELHFPSTATFDQRLRWLEIVLEEMKARDNHAVYVETPGEEKLKQLLAHTVYIKPDRITLHSLTADPASVVAGDEWYRNDLGKVKLAVDAVVANAKLLRLEGDTVPAAEIADLDAAKITSGRFGMARMPDGTSGQVLTGQGAGNNPAYASISGIPSGIIAMWSGLLANIPSGWVICDGNNGTPNLLAKFVEGVADGATNPGATGGAVSKTTAGHAHETNILYASGGQTSIYKANQLFGTGTTRTASSYSTGTSASGQLPAEKTQSVTDSIADIRPAYYDVAFIMKT